MIRNCNALISVRRNAFVTKKLMVRSTLSEICSTLLRRFFRFRSIWKSFKITQFWKVLQRIMIHVSHSLKWSMPQKTKLHDIFRLHASRFFEASTEWGKKYDFRFFKWRRFQFFSETLISASSGGSMHEILTPESIAEGIHSMPEWLTLTPNTSTPVVWRLPLKDFSGFWLRDSEKRTPRDKTKHSAPKKKWCEALSLKSDRPYYVDFSVFDRSGKVLKSRNSEKFCKELWFMWVIPWNQACLKK